MAETVKKLGKLGLDIVEHFVESKLGEKFVKDLRAPTDEYLAIKGAMQATADRLWKEWADKRLWNAVFIHLPKKKELLNDLRKAVNTFYKHPTDMGFADVLTEILQAHHEFSLEEINTAAERYVEVLAEELVQVDETFRENRSALAVVRGEKWQHEIAASLHHLENVQPTPPAVFRPGSVPPRPSLMIGRDDDIRALKERLSIPSDAKASLQVLTAIKGWPGVGKTTVASALAYDPELAKVFPDGVLWTSLGQNPIILSEMAAWGRALGTEEILKAKSVEEAKSLLAGLLRNRRMLLIIDDVWKDEDAVPFMVGGLDCATLITTRLDGVASALAPMATNVYRLKVLKDEDALELLRRLAPSVVKQHPKECLVLVQELEGLPLALQVAGRLLNTEASYGFGVTELIDELREGAKLLEATSPADRINLVTETTPTIAALLHKSLDRLDETTRDCYAYLGVFAPKPATFDMNAMKYIWKTDDPKPVIKTLIDRGLLEFLPELGRYQMHALLVMLAKTLLTDDDK
jgi:hypothetical protein